MPIAPILFLIACAAAPVHDTASDDNNDISGLPEDAEVAEETTGAVRINEVMADYVGGTDPAESGDWFELVNVGDADIDMQKVVMDTGVDDDDDLSQARAANNCDVSLSPGDHLLVYAGHVLDQYSCWINETLLFNGDALSVWVLDESGSVDDWTLSNRVEWTGLDGPVSLARYPDTTGPWLVDESPTPRAAND